MTECVCEASDLGLLEFAQNLRDNFPTNSMSREEKEKLLSEKMENIRKRNEELCKRHEEIEADKKNADIFSSTVTMDKVKPYIMKTPRSRTEKSERPRDANNMSNLPRPSDIMPSRQRLSEDDGPPPDPSYRFLSDPDRDGNEREKKREGRGKRKGKNVSKVISEGQEEEESKHKGEGDNLSITPKEDSGDNSFGDEEDKNSIQGKGRGKEFGKLEMTNEQRHGTGRGKGRGRGYDRSMQNDEGRQIDSKVMYSPREGNDANRGRERSGLSFASRDIRYYPDDEDDRMIGRQGKIRGRERRNFNPRKYSEDSGNPGDRKGTSGQRGRGRGRNNDQQREYERWKAERAAIDEARLSRGRTDGGSWRREWDHDKISQGEANGSEPAYDPRYPRSKSSNFKLADLINLPNNDDRSHQANKKQAKTKREGKDESCQESREKSVKVEEVKLEEATDNPEGSDYSLDQNTTDHVMESPKEEETPLAVADMKDVPEGDCAEDLAGEVIKDPHQSMENVGDRCSDEDRQECEKDSATLD